jgi:hypothetical protein
MHLEATTKASKRSPFVSLPELFGEYTGTACARGPPVQLGHFLKLGLWQCHVTMNVVDAAAHLEATHS